MLFSIKIMSMGLMALGATALVMPEVVPSGQLSPPVPPTQTAVVTTAAYPTSVAYTIISASNTVISAPTFSNTAPTPTLTNDGPIPAEPDSAHYTPRCMDNMTLEYCQEDGYTYRCTGNTLNVFLGPSA